MPIIPAASSDFPSLLSLWEASVKATHHFLEDGAIDDLRPHILEQYFPVLSLYQYVDHDATTHGFIGIHDNRIEMLFVSPQSRGMGIGKQLLLFAIQQCNTTLLDVNEQNTQAVLFYQHMGFIQTGRSDTDAQGRPYPLLHMRYQPAHG